MNDVVSEHGLPSAHSKSLKNTEQPGSTEHTLEAGGEATYSDMLVSDDISPRSKKRLPPMGHRTPKPRGQAKNLRMARANEMTRPIMLGKAVWTPQMKMCRDCGSCFLVGSLGYCKSLSCGLLDVYEKKIVRWCKSLLYSNLVIVMCFVVPEPSGPISNTFMSGTFLEA